MKQENKLKIVYVKASDLKPAPYNPKKMTQKEAQDLEASMRKFGIVDPLVVNGAENRKNIMIGGHQRYKIGTQILKYTEFPVVYLDIPDENIERELNLRLTKNTGSWDWDMLANFEETTLKEAGFTSTELDKMFKNEGEDGEIKFTQELNEEHNYLVLTFDNEIDWLQLMSVYKLPTVKALDSKPGFEKKGVGRVVNGREFLNEVLKK